MSYFSKTNLNGMAFDHDFAYSYPLFSSLLKKREKEKEDELAKILIKGHVFQSGAFPKDLQNGTNKPDDIF